MRQKNKQGNSEVMGQCSPGELLDKPLTHGSHPSIHPVSQLHLALLLPNCVSLILSVRPRGLQLQWEHDSLEWLEKMAPRSECCPVSAHATFNSEEYKDTKWKEMRAGALLPEGSTVQCVCSFSRKYNHMKSEGAIWRLEKFAFLLRCKWEDDSCIYAMKRQPLAWRSLAWRLEADRNR